MYKIFRKIHLWLAVPFGLVISLICATGFILLFEPAHEHGASRPEFFLDVMRLHRWLFDAPAQKGMMTTGKMIVGISAIAMALILISGIILWAYRLKGGLARNLKIRFTKGFHSFCASFHNAGGAYVALFLFIMAVTGLTWSFGGYRTWFYDLFNIEKGSHVVYAIHTGSFWGIVTQIIWGLSALTGFTLPLTGYYLWIKRLSLRRAARK